MPSDREIANRLLTLASMIMEDVLPISLIDDEAMSVEDRVRHTADAGRAVVSLAEAAAIVLSRPGEVID